MMQHDLTVGHYFMKSFFQNSVYKLQATIGVRRINIAKKFKCCKSLEMSTSCYTA